MGTVLLWMIAVLLCLCLLYLLLLGVSALAPTMNGRFYGGGMMPTPDQDRLGPNRTVSTLVLFGSGKLKTLAVFPSIFKGEHIKHTEMVEVLTGHDITVEFDRPAPIQIDGETIIGVSSYHVTSEVRSPMASDSCVLKRSQGLVC